MICDFDFKSFFGWFWIWYDVFGKKITLQYISFVTVNLHQFTSMPDFSQTFRVLHFKPLPQLPRKMRTMDMILQLNCCWWITPSCSCKSCQRKGLADPVWLSQRLWSTILLCRARHQSSTFSALEDQVVWWCFWATANVEDKYRHLKWNFDDYNDLKFSRTWTLERYAVLFTMTETLQYYIIFTRATLC